MNVSPKDYALRFIANTVDQTPYAFNYRLFTLTGLQWGDFNTKGQNITINKPTLTGMFKDPSFSGADWRQFVQLKGDKSNQAAFNAFLTATETLGQESA
jgi:hypothetical protein